MIKYEPLNSIWPMKVVGLSTIFPANFGAGRDSISWLSPNALEALPMVCWVAMAGPLHLPKFRFMKF